MGNAGCKIPLGPLVKGVAGEVGVIMLLAVRDAPAARIVTFECPRTLRGSVRMLRSPRIRRKVSCPRRMISAPGS